MRQRARPHPCPALTLAPPQETLASQQRFMCKPFYRTTIVILRILNYQNKVNHVLNSLCLGKTLSHRTNSNTKGTPSNPKALLPAPRSWRSPRRCPAPQQRSCRAPAPSKSSSDCRGVPPRSLKFDFCSPGKREQNPGSDQ